MFIKTKEEKPEAEATDCVNEEERRGGRGKLGRKGTDNRVWLRRMRCSSRGESWDAKRLGPWCPG